MSTAIEWTDETWNPLRGCTKISAGCKHCYAETFAERWRGVAGHPYEQGFDLRLVPHKLTEPLGWERPRRIFVNSMSDLFHERVPLDYIALVAEVMRASTWHEFQLLTKRGERLEAASRLLDLELPNAILGVSVEDRRHGLPRIEQLRRARVRHRFLSIEPLLEDLGEVDLAGIDWVIVGGESGAGARPLAPAWVRSLRDQCEAQAVPFFFKQWGGVHKKTTGRELDGRTHDAAPTLELAKAPRAKARRARRVELDALCELMGPRLLPRLTRVRTFSVGGLPPAPQLGLFADPSTGRSSAQVGSLVEASRLLLRTGVKRVEDVVELDGRRIFAGELMARAADEHGDPNGARWFRRELEQQQRGRDA